MVGHVVSLGTKTTTNKERHGYYGSEQTMPAFLISYPCTRVVNSKEHMALVVHTSTSLSKLSSCTMHTRVVNPIVYMAPIRTQRRMYQSILLQS